MVEENPIINKCMICEKKCTDYDRSLVIEIQKLQSYYAPTFRFDGDCFNVASPKLSGRYIQGQDLEESKECIVCKTEIPRGETYILPEIIMILDNKSINSYGIPNIVYPYGDLISYFHIYDIGICTKCSDIKMINNDYPIRPFFAKKNPFSRIYKPVYPEVRETPKRIKLELKPLKFIDKVRGLSPEYEKLLPEIKNKYTNEFNNLIGDLKNIVDNIIQEFRAKKDEVTWEDHWETSTKEIHEKVEDLQKRYDLEVENLLKEYAKENEPQG